MSREWKPGDVARAFVKSRSRDHTLLRIPPEQGIYVWQIIDGGGSPEDLLGNAVVENPRPLLVIDPEDREQVQRLVELLGEHGWTPTEAHGLRDALRSLLDPKPDEPTGLGAVVRDRDGDRWVHCRQPGHRGLQGVEWENERTCAHNRWSDIDVASEDDILSEGVIV